MSLISLISLVPLMSLMPLQAQVFEKAPLPSTQSSSEGRQPFGPLRIVPDEPGDETNPGGGGNNYDDKDVNDNDASVGDLHWLLPALAIGYGIYNRIKQTKNK